MAQLEKMIENLIIKKVDEIEKKGGCEGKICNCGGSNKKQNKSKKEKANQKANQKAKQQAKQQEPEQEQDEGVFRPDLSWCNRLKEYRAIYNVSLKDAMKALSKKKA